VHTRRDIAEMTLRRYRAALIILNKATADDLVLIDDELRAIPFRAGHDVSRRAKRVKLDLDSLIREFGITADLLALDEIFKAPPDSRETLLFFT
jgi:hypothetical protein